MALPALLSSLGGSMFSPSGGGGETPSSATSSASTPFSTGGLTITKTNPTTIVALVIGGIVLALIIKGRK